VADGKCIIIAPVELFRNHARFHGFAPFNFQNIGLLATGSQRFSEPLGERAIDADKSLFFDDASTDYIEPKRARRRRDSCVITCWQLEEFLEFLDYACVQSDEFFSSMANYWTRLLVQYVWTDLGWPWN
jgi:hypothetical protein